LLDEARPKGIRQIYTGKLLSRVSMRESPSYLFTVRPGAFPSDKRRDYRAEVVRREAPADLPAPRKQFIEFVDTGAGDVDISQADLLVSIGRGIGEGENVAAMKELADLMGGVISCSRPVVDKNWLPKYHQVGTSGKSVKPKVYLALGISGAFQHVAGLSGAGTVIAVNKDKKAPIFRVAHYGVVDDLFKVAEALKEKLKG
ncbi:MAG: electron transfer flavoprotein subunit alpha/FixB family protein, partial [Deltaproteobacteria bacterium]|nr:electron transfer flavoprotein subunit alpha/FixB family protein [Deltaproteobacteria bacterium]